MGIAGTMSLQWHVRMQIRVMSQTQNVISSLSSMIIHKTTKYPLNLIVENGMKVIWSSDPNHEETKWKHKKNKKEHGSNMGANRATFGRKFEEHLVFVWEKCLEVGIFYNWATTSSFYSSARGWSLRIQNFSNILHRSRGWEFIAAICRCLSVLY